MFTLNQKILEAIQQELFEIVPLNIAVIDRDYNIVAANKNFENYFGNWEGRRCYEVYKGLDKPCTNCPSNLVFQDGEVRESDETGIDRHGNSRHYVGRVAPIKDDNGVVKYVVEMTSDITEREQSQQHYNLLFERVPCYITIIDRNYRIARANEKFRETFGEVRGKFCYEVYKRRTTPCDNCPAALTFEDGLEHSSTQVGVTRTGAPSHYRVNTSPLSRGEEGVAHVIEIATDITEIKTLEREVLDKERLAAVGQTVAGLAHTIKNLLTGLEAGLFMLNSGLTRVDSARVTKGWKVTQRNFDKITDVVKDFLAFAKGRLPQLKMSDPNKIARNIVDLYREPARRHGVELVCQPDENVISAPLDPDGMESCLTNLVSNAIDAAVRREDDEGKVIVRTSDVDDTLIFEVTDNGPGMDAEIKQKIFTTFFTTKGGKGTGLGLLTTQKIVHEHGGTMDVESEESVGSTFRIRLPRYRLEDLMAEISGDNQSTINNRQSTIDN